MKINLITSLVLGFVTISPFSVFAQDMQEDSLVVPGNLFQISKIRNTGAISSASGDALYKSATPNLTNAFSGNLAGLTVIKGNGIPGEGTARMYIRGIGSYSRGETNSLKFYVDGFEVKGDYVEHLTPEEIESVSIMKDAAALSTFGMNGANGVVWIETKRGTVSAPVVNFQIRTGIQQPVNVVKPLDSYGYARLYNQAVSNDNGRIWSPTYSDSDLASYLSGQGVNVDWYDEVFRDNGMYTDAALSFRGGSDFVRYNVVLDYANQQGLFDIGRTESTSNATYVKYGLRTNLDMKLNKVLTVSVDVGGRIEDRTRPNYDVASLVSDVMHYPANIYPIYDVKAADPISNFSGTAVHPNNPVASLKGLGWTTSRTKFMQANFKFREDLGFLLKGLYLEEGFSFYNKTIGNTGKTRTYARYLNGVAQTSDQSTYIRSNSYYSSGKELWMQGNVTLGYRNQFGKNCLDVALNGHISDYSGNASSFYDWKYRYVNFNGRANYTYDDRYVAELGFSYFGSDAYAPGHRFVFYPTASLGWILSNETFLQSSDVVKYLKVRGSVGLSGATEADLELADFDTGGRFLYQQYYAAGGGFVTGLGPSFGWGDSGLVPLFMANPNVTAEQSLKYNVGLDVNFANRLSITADYFMDKRNGILTLDQSLMDYYGKNVYYANIGKMTNQGFDANIVFADRVGEFNYSLFGNILYAVNRVDHMGEVQPKFDYNASTGLPYGTRMGLECVGFYDVNDFDADGSLKNGIPEPLFGQVQPGDLRYKDQDGDKYIDETDVVKIGNPAYPKWSYSFGGELSFKGFDFSLMFSGNAGGTVDLMDYDTWKPFLDYGTAFKWAEGAWAYYPDQGIDTRAVATFPRLTAEQNENNYRPSTFWIRKNNFLRLQNVEIGYDFSVIRAVRNAHISKCRLYVNAFNLLTFSSLLKNYGIDPETADYGYPSLKSFNIGLQIGF